ncbi:hypothetical protein DSO57_1017578 [Entomophthora muscae]|uniref:Uncharacterized protein n=1 Tax=Entomophthora muscae TaxID=34485 RepID=A0ACC2UEA0_9FUNG|nr:hypothetical protein DSO57_1017578 [Entomophthora muscae]
MESGRQRKFNGMDQFMDAFNSQVARLEMLWQDQGLYQPEDDPSLPPSGLSRSYPPS